MARLKTELLGAGMTVARDITNLDGILLIPAGSTLSDRQIGILQAWGVTEVEVQASEALPDADPLARLSPQEATKLRKQLRDLFWRPAESDPIFVEIFELLLRREARKRTTRTS